jgi:stress-induced morphogen
MSTDVKKKNDRTDLIEEKLGSRFPSAEVYQYNPVSIRVRIIDERFQGKSNVEREKLLSDLLQQLPEEVEADITLLLLLTREEAEHSMMNVAFDYPSPSIL